MREMGLLSIALKRPCINFSALLEGGGRGRHYPAYFSLKIQKREAKLIFGGQWEKCFCVVAIFCEKDALWKLKWKWTCGLYFLLWFFPASQEEFVWERLPIWNSRKCVRGAGTAFSILYGLTWGQKILWAYNSTAVIFLSLRCFCFIKTLKGGNKY